MARRPVDLNALRDFVAVVDHAGFGPASRALGSSKSTLSRRVRELEDALAARLIERTSRNFRLTAEGQALHERAVRALAEVDEAERWIRDQDTSTRGPLRISAPLLFGHMFLGRLAAEYRAACPEVDLEIALDNRYVDLLPERFDAAIRRNAMDTAELVGRRFARDSLILVAPPALVRKRSRGRVSDQRAWPAVVYDSALMTGPWKIVDQERSFEVIPQVVLRLDSLFMVKDAVLAGAGAALLPHSMVSRELEAGELERVGAVEGGEAVFSIVHPSRRLVSRRLRAFIEMLVRAFPHGDLAVDALR